MRYYNNPPSKKNTAPRHDDESVSLNKYISDTGFCSRREADDYIAQIRVTINNQDAHKGNRVYPGDVVLVDGEPIKKKVKTIYMAFNKPGGVTSTTDTKDKTNIISFIGFPQRIFPIGRLDKDSEGLIFLTNDGNIVNKILRAGNNHEKEYIVTVDQPLTPEFLKQMAAGVKISGGEWTQPAKVNQEGKSTFRITLTQGLNRQIRRMCEALGYRVKKLIRVRIMNVHLGKLPSGHWRYLTDDEVILIQKMVSDSSKTEEASRIAKTPKTKTPNSKPVQQEKEEAPEEEDFDFTEEDFAKSSAPQKPAKKKSYKDFKKTGGKK
ncbi:23S rRNA pseudouridine(2604) synthase RluF [Chitinophagaceae bacterium MMS25-I14]